MSVWEKKVETYFNIKDKGQRMIYYEKEMLLEARERFMQNNETTRKRLVREEEPHMIITVGLVYEPIVFAIDLVKPQSILFLHTTDSLEMVNKIVELTKLSKDQFLPEKVKEDSATEVYSYIKQYYEQKNKPKNIYVNATGGTKIMSQAACKAVNVIAGKLIHISAKYKGRDPIPGSESFQVVEDPYIVFGDLEYERGIKFFNTGNWENAKSIFHKLADEIEESELKTKAQCLEYLTKSYSKWDELDFKEAYKQIEKINFECDLLNQKERLETQKNILNQLVHLTPNQLEQNQEANKCLMLSIYDNASRREQEKKYDIAVLLMYRVLEMIGQQRLLENHIIHERPDYNNLSISKALFIERVNRLQRKVYKDRSKPFNEREKLALLNGYIVLAALGDELISGEGEKEKLAVLKKLKQKVRIRNQGIFTHGYQIIEQEKYMDFKELVKELLTKYFELTNVSVEEELKAYRFITL